LRQAQPTFPAVKIKYSSRTGAQIEALAEARPNLDQSGEPIRIIGDEAVCRRWFPASQFAQHVGRRLI
jgi:hypothetical protein